MQEEHQEERVSGEACSPRLLQLCGPWVHMGQSQVQPDACAEDEGGYCSSVPEKLISGQILSKP